jgi:hypothetical protein
MEKNHLHRMDHLKNQSEAFKMNHHEALHDMLEQFLDSLNVHVFDSILTDFYDTHLHHQEVLQQMIFKKNFVFIQQQSRLNLKQIITYIMHQMYTIGNPSPLSTIIEMSLMIHHQNFMLVEIYKAFIAQIESHFNTYIKDTIIDVNTWAQIYTRLKPVAFVVCDEIPQRLYLESCRLHDLLCLSKNKFETTLLPSHFQNKVLYYQYKNSQTYQQRWTHIWTYHRHYIKNLHSETMIQTLDMDTMQTLHLSDSKSKKYILPVPEDLIEFELWTYKYLKQDIKNNQYHYILWLKNDNLLTHFKRIPKDIEVIIDLNVIGQEYFNLNPLQSISLKDFNDYFVPILREIHQTLRVKKTTHYLYGNVLSQPEVYHRCLTLGFRYIIIHRPYLYIAISESLKFIKDYPHI